MPYPLCAIDMDDTLLDPNHEITPLSAQAIQQTREAGVTVVVASGRMHAATRRYTQQLQLDTPVISYNGAMVKNAATGEVWLEEHVDADLAAEIRQFARENNLQLNYYLHDILFSAAQTQWLALYQSRTGAPIEILPDFETRLQGTTPTKLVFVDSPERIAGLLKPMQERFGQKSYVTRSNDEYLEFMPPNADKGKALALVASKLGVTAAQTVAFGDSWNDIPMLKWAGKSCAVANAKPEVRGIAGEIIGSNTEDGVAHALAAIYGFTL